MNPRKNNPFLCISSNRLSPLIVAGLIATGMSGYSVRAASLNWDANNPPDVGVVTDGGGAWLGTDQWWDGAVNVTWTDNNDAAFGAGGAGAGVTLSSPVTATSITFNSFTGTYTLGATGGSAITVSSGAITKYASLGTATINSPIFVASNATFYNELSVPATSLNLGVVGETGGSFNITKTGPGQVSMQAASTYSGTTTIEEGNLGPSNASAFGTSTTPVALGNPNTITNSLSPSLLMGGAGTVLARDIIVGASNAAQASGIYTIGTGNVSSAAGITGTVTLNQSLSVSAVNQNNTFTLGGSGIISGSSGTQTVTFNNSNSGNSVILVTGVIGGGPGTIALTKAAGSGVTTLTNANTYTGATTISAGVLQLGNGGATGSLSPSSPITNNATLAFNRTGTVTQGTDFAPVIAGTGAVRKNGSATLVLNGANTYSGGTTINAGTLTVAPGGTLGATTGALVVNNPNTGAATNVVLNLATGADTTVGPLSGTLAAATPAAPANTVTINTGGVGRNFIVNETAASTYNGVIAGAGNFVLGSLSTNSLSLPVANTYTGTTTLESGTITASNPTALGNATSAVAMGSATSITDNLSPTLQVNGNTTIARNFTIGASNAATTGTYTIGTGNANSSAQINGTVTLNQSLTVAATNQGGGTFTLAGSVTSGSSGTQTVTFNHTNQLVASAVIGGGVGTIAVTKNGTGTTTLSGNNTYTGDTTLNAGRLRVNGNSIPNTGKLVINGGTVEPTGTEVVNTLYFGTVQQAAGTWGTSTTVPTPDHIDDVHFFGTAGVVNVTTGPAGYAEWASTNAPGQTKDQDYDNDGVQNGIEYFMGVTGSGFTVSPSLSGGTVTWTKGGSYVGTYGTDFLVQTSTDLVVWTLVPVGTDPLLGTVTNNAGSVSYTPPTGQMKRFGRLIVNN